MAPDGYERRVPFGTGLFSISNISPEMKNANPSCEKKEESCELRNDALNNVFRLDGAGGGNVIKGTDGFLRFHMLFFSMRRSTIKKTSLANKSSSKTVQELYFFLLSRELNVLRMALM